MVNHTIKLLVVDDNPADSRRLIRLTQRLAGWTIDARECADSDECREAFAAFRPDVVFVDYLLDAETGLDLVRGLPEGIRRESAFILLTGQGDEEVAANALRAGVLDYLTKDALTGEKLEHALRFAIQRVSDRRALRHRDAILQAVAQVAESFLKTQDWRSVITESLAVLAQAADVSRAYLFKNFSTSDDGLRARQLFEWTAPDITPQIDNPDLQDFHYREAGCGHWAEAMGGGQCFQGLVSELSEAESSMLGPQNIQAIMLAPIFVEGGWWGVLDFDECRRERLWSDVELDALRTAASTLGAAIQREKMEQMMRLQATAIETAANAIFITDADGVFLWANPAFSRITGYTAEDIQGETPRILKSNRHDEAFYRELWETIKDGQVWRGEMADRRKDGSLYIQETTISPVRNHEGHVTRFVSVQQDITLRKELEERLRAQAEFDALTGLPNRRLFEDRLIQAVALAGRNKTHLVLMFVDLDHFKAVNDTLGHDAGDELLREAANRLKACVRRSDTVARLGGDEFTVILPEVTHPTLAELVAKKILEQLERPFFPTGREARISGSIGIAVFPGDGRDMETLMKCADEAMYRSKKADRAAYHFFNPEAVSPGTGDSHMTTRGGNTDPDPISLQSLRILLVDDEEADAAAFRRRLGSALTGRPFDLTHAASFREGLTALSGRTFDLCFFDYRLGVETGLDLLRKARTLGVTSPVVFLTGQGDEETAVTLMKSGAVDYLSKDRLTPETLSRSIHYALGISASERRRKAAEEALFEKSVHLDNVLRSATDLAIITTDPAFIVKYFNPMAGELLGISREEAVGASVEEIHRRLGVDPERFRLGLGNIEQKGEHRFEVVLEKGDGPHHLDARASGVLDETGNLAGYCLTVRDVTERKRLLRNLEGAVLKADAANRAKSEFLATMSHEIRTPMNVILGMGELLSETNLTETQTSFVNTLNRSGQGLQALINDILDLSKIESGQLALERIPFDLRRLIDEVMDLFAFTAAEKGIGIELAFAEGVPPFVHGDPTRLRQILVNLVGNAVKFTVRGGIKVTVAVDPDGGMSFAVADTGPGIAPAKQEQIFQPFTQVDTSTTRTHGGTGLGLTICRRLVEMMGGRIHLESEEDRGSRFTARLPLPEVARESVAASGDAHDGPDGMPTVAPSGLRILLVEDALDNQMIIQAFLEKTPHDVIVAENGREAVGRFKEGGIDLVLMDIQMPVMDGYAATRSVRAWERETTSPPTPIIALTAHAMQEESIKIREAGCNLHLTKPIRKNHLLETIAQTVVNRSGTGR